MDNPDYRYRPRRTISKHGPTIPTTICFIHPSHHALSPQTTRRDLLAQKPERLPTNPLAAINHLHTHHLNPNHSHPQLRHPNLGTLESLCRSNSTTLPLILLAYTRTLARHTSTASPTLGLYQAGRSASFKNIDQLCAPTPNVLPEVIPSGLSLPVGKSAKGLQADLAELVGFEQGYLPKVLATVGYGTEGKPLCNTFVNILS